MITTATIIRSLITISAPLPIERDQLRAPLILHHHQHHHQQQQQQQQQQQHPR
jgi:hypothetical protein